MTPEETKTMAKAAQVAHDWSGYYRGMKPTAAPCILHSDAPRCATCPRPTRACGRERDSHG